MKSTKDYSMFKFKKGNRKIYDAHIKELMESFKEMGADWAKVFPVVVNKKFEILDGQHRLLARKALKLPIYYAVVNGKVPDLEKIWMINSTQKKWSLNDCVALCAESGLQDYKTLLDTSKALGLTANVTANLVGKQGQIKERRLKFTDGDRNVATAILYLASQFDTLPFRHSWRFLKAIKAIYNSKDAPIARFIEYARKHGHKIKKQPSSREYLLAVLRDYNSRTKTRKIDIRLSELEQV